jgi:hypothetical protein
MGQGRWPRDRARGRARADAGPRPLAGRDHQPLRAGRHTRRGEDSGRSGVRRPRHPDTFAAGGDGPPAHPSRVPAWSRPRGEEHAASRLEPAREPHVAPRRRSRRRAQGGRDAILRREHAGAAAEWSPRVLGGRRRRESDARADSRLLPAPRRGSAHARVRPRGERQVLAGLLATLRRPRSQRQHESARGQARGARDPVAVPHRGADGGRGTAAGERPHLQHVVRQAPYRDDLVARRALSRCGVIRSSWPAISSGIARACPTGALSPAAAVSTARAGPRWWDRRDGRARAGTP